MVRIQSSARAPGGRADAFTSRALLLILAVGLAAGSAADLGATEGPIVFLDGFESSDTCAWTGTCAPPASVTGVWAGAIDFSGSVRSMVVQLHERADGRLIGYVLGGTNAWTMTSGSYSGGSLSADLALSDAGGDRVVHLAGSVAGGEAALAVSGDVPAQTATFRRWPAGVSETEFVFADPSLGDAGFVELAVAVGEGGTLLGGAFTSPAACLLWACEGGVTAFDESGDTLTVALDSEGGCSDGSSATVTYDGGAGYYLGSYSFTDCAGTVTGSVASAPIRATQSGHVAQILTRLGAIADQYEAGLPFAAPHPAFAADYLHGGANQEDVFAVWNGEMASHAGLVFDIPAVRLVNTVEDPREPLSLATQRGAEIEIVRSGAAALGKAPSVTLFDSRSDLLFNAVHNPLRVWEEVGGEWVVSGDHQPPLDLPWQYTVDSASGRLDTPTGRAPAHVSIGVYAGHFSPHTGHAFGDPKTNGAGFLPADDSELDELVGDGIGDDDGICESGEACAYYGGLAGDGTCTEDGCLVRDRTPTYTSPQSGYIYTIIFYEAPSGTYFDNPPQWEVEIAFANGVAYRLVHVAAFTPAFAAKVAAATGCDPASWESCGLSPGDELMDVGGGDPPIPVAAGEEVCLPQVLATAVPGHPGYYTGDGSFPKYPWAQMELFVRGTFDFRGYNFCVYDALSQAVRGPLATAMATDMLNPGSLRYHLGLQWPDWQWAAESEMCNAPTLQPVDFSGLSTRLGGWFERAEAGTTQDELFAFVPVHRSGPAYDPTLYDPADPDALVTRRRVYGLGPFSWTMPDDSVVAPFAPTAEVLAITSSTMLLKWREIGYTAGNVPVYQRAAYRLDAYGLAIKWGAFADTAGGAPQPILLPGEPCDDTTVICYDHHEFPGF